MSVSRRRSLCAVILLVVVSIAVHAVWFGYPNSAVFDEVHFGKFISAYFTHEYYFDIHPPLGKLILAGWGWLWGYQPGFSFANIGEVYPNRLYVALRFLPMLAGSLLPLVVYGLARQLRLSHVASLMAGILVAFDNALLVQSRFILLDSFLLLFGFGGLYCYFRFRHRGNVLLLVAAGVLGGMAASIKWTGLTFLALMILCEAVIVFQKTRQNLLKNALTVSARGLFCLGIVPIVLYASVFAVHFALLSKSGPGDAFMSTQFQHGLAGSRYAEDRTLHSPSTLGKIIELNGEMYRSNQRLTATHPYASAWYAWPLMLRPIFYWVQNSARIYLFGNPVVWWLSTIAVVAAFFQMLFSGIRAAPKPLLVMTGAWLMNILPFVGITRVMFLYHYLTALIWAILILVYMVDRSRNKKQIALGVSLTTMALFVFFAPLSYGLTLSDGAYHARMWFSSWQ